MTRCIDRRQEDSPVIRKIAGNGFDTEKLRIDYAFGKLREDVKDLRSLDDIAQNRLVYMNMIASSRTNRFAPPGDIILGAHYIGMSKLPYSVERTFKSGNADSNFQDALYDFLTSTESTVKSIQGARVNKRKEAQNFLYKILNKVEENINLIRLENPAANIEDRLEQISINMAAHRNSVEKICSADEAVLKNVGGRELTFHNMFYKDGPDFFIIDGKGTYTTLPFFIGFQGHLGRSRGYPEAIFQEFMQRLDDEFVNEDNRVTKDIGKTLAGLIDMRKQTEAASNIADELTELGKSESAA
jgi:hypothetical protein